MMAVVPERNEEPSKLTNLPCERAFVEMKYTLFEVYKWATLLIN